MDKKNIVVLGAGFGGLTAATRLAKGLKRRNLLEKYQVTLVDRNDYQIYTPFLYRYVAKTTGKPLDGECVWPLIKLIKGLPITFMQGDVSAIDLMHGDIHLEKGEEMPVDVAVLALGSESNDFGIPGAKENTTPLKTFANAKAIRESLAGILLSKPDANIVIGGAGANGIEVAAQIKHLHPAANVSIVEAMPSVLPGLDARVAAAAAKRLAKIGVSVRLNAKIMRIDSGVVVIDGASEPMAFDFMIWTAGIKAPGLVSQLPLTAERGKPMANPGLDCLPQTPELTLAPKVYAIGDSVCFMDPATKRPLPSVANVAIAQAIVVSENILGEIDRAEGKPVAMPRAYVPGMTPTGVYVISVGGPWAIAKIGKIVITGFPAWIFKRFVALEYLTSTLPLSKALALWMA